MPNLDSTQEVNNSDTFSSTTLSQLFAVCNDLSLVAGVQFSQVQLPTPSMFCKHWSTFTMASVIGLYVFESGSFV